MSSPTLTFTPAMWHASKAGRKNTTRRLITADCFLSADRRLKVLGDEGTSKTAAHQPGQIKPMVTSWAVGKDCDAAKPCDINKDALIAEIAADLHGLWWDDGSQKPTWAGKTRPGRFLPKSLYSLAPQVEILTVHPEFLHDITAAGALQEGISTITKDDGRTWKFGLADHDGFPGTDDFGWPWQEWRLNARDAYFKLWDTINAQKAKGQYAATHNPPCWVITYRLLTTSVQL